MKLSEKRHWLSGAATRTCPPRGCSAGRVRGLGVRMREQVRRRHKWREDSVLGAGKVAFGASPGRRIASGRRVLGMAKGCHQEEGGRRLYHGSNKFVWALLLLGRMTPKRVKAGLV